MRILEAFGEPVSHGGQEAFVMNVLENIDMTGLEFDVITPYYCDNDRIREFVRSSGGEVYDLGCRFRPGRIRAEAERPIREFLKNHYYDAIHIHSGSNSMLSMYSRLADRAGIKRIIVHSHCTGRKGWKHAASKMITSIPLSFFPTDYLACSAEAGEWRFPAKICERRLVVIKNGIDINKFRFDDVKRRLMRERLGAGAEDLLIGNVGRLTRQKNQSFLLELLPLMRDRYTSSHMKDGQDGKASGRPSESRIRLILIGEGEDMGMLKTRAGHLGISDDVIFTGNVDNVEDYLQAIDVLVMPSEFEGLAIAVIEGQAAGLEVIASEGIPEMANVTGRVRLIPLADTEGWIEALSAVHERHPEQAEDIARHGFGVKEAAAAVRSLYTGA